MKQKVVTRKVFSALAQFISTDTREEYGGYLLYGDPDNEKLEGLVIKTNGVTKRNDNGNIESFIVLPNEKIIFHTHPSGRNVPSGQDLVSALKRHPALDDKKGTECGKTEVGLVITDIGVWIISPLKKTISKLLKFNRSFGENIKGKRANEILQNTIIKPLDSLVTKFYLEMFEMFNLESSKEISKNEWFKFIRSVYLPKMKFLGFKIELHKIDTDLNITDEWFANPEDYVDEPDACFVKKIRIENQENLSEEDLDVKRRKLKE
jgi:hypothetical protein